MAFRLTPWPKRGRRNERAHTPKRHAPERAVPPAPAAAAAVDQLTAGDSLLRDARRRKTALSELRDDDDIDLPAVAPAARAKPENS